MLMFFGNTVYTRVVRSAYIFVRNGQNYTDDLVKSKGIFFDVARVFNKKRRPLHTKDSIGVLGSKEGTQRGGGGLFKILKEMFALKC